MELTFSIDLSAEEGGGSVELVKNGRDLEVNATNVYNYVRKYSQYRYALVHFYVSCKVRNVFFRHFRMITCQEKALENMKMGVYDVLPAGSLDGLTAEDFRLLLNGVRILSEISVSNFCQIYISFIQYLLYRSEISTSKP